MANENKPLRDANMSLVIEIKRLWRDNEWWQRANVISDQRVRVVENNMESLAGVATELRDVKNYNDWFKRKANIDEMRIKELEQKVVAIKQYQPATAPCKNRTISSDVGSCRGPMTQRCTACDLAYRAS